MGFFEVMINLLVGISGGIFSSIIVSRIFLIVTDYSEQISKVQRRVEVFYGLHGALWAAQKLLKGGCNELGEQYKDKLKELINDENKQYNQMIYDDLEDDLHTLAVEYSDFTNDFNVDHLDENEVEKNIQKINGLVNKFQCYKDLHKKKMLGLIFKDFVLRILFSIFGVVIILTVIA